VNEIRIAGYQNVSANVGIRVGAFNAISGHLYVYAVFDPGHPRGLRGSAAVRQSGRNVDWLDTGGIEGWGIINELTGPF
jgi:hypothetical protein